MSGGLETVGIEEAAKLLCVNEELLDKLTRKGIVPGYKPGRRWVYVREDIAQLDMAAILAPPIYKDPKRNARNARRRAQLRPKLAEYFSWHRASKALRTPPWSDRGAVRVFYDIARRATDCTGIPFNVDHLYPLHGRTISGLHVPENLRVLPRWLNQSKGNRL